MRSPDPITPRSVPADGLLLRPFAETDEADVATALRDPDIRRWAAGMAVATAPEPRRASLWIEERMAGWRVGSAVFAVTDAESGALLGSVSVREANRLPDQGAVTYWVTPACRGRGIAARALDAAARWAFASPDDNGLGLHRLTLDHALVNTGSCRVAGRTGFTLEGTMREYYLDAGGARHDSHLHARLATDR
ncbi:MAG: GNAT family protein [Actinocatenispora sp.]